MLAEKRLEELGIELPESSEAKAMYVPVKRFGNLLFISGQIPTVGSEAPYTGKVGGSLSLEQAQEAARLCTINMLAAVRHETGDLDSVKNVIKLQAFVSSAPGFDKQHHRGERSVAAAVRRLWRARPPRQNGRRDQPAPP